VRLRRYGRWRGAFGCWRLEVGGEKIEVEKVRRWEGEMKGLSAGGLGANWHRAERMGSKLKGGKVEVEKNEGGKVCKRWKVGR
jgi:hypothetical protein